MEIWSYKKLLFIIIRTLKESFFFLMFIYFWERERERQSASGGRTVREGDTESDAGSRLWAVSTEPDAGLEPTDREIMAWARVGRLTDWATQAPLYLFLKQTECKWGRGRERGRHRIWSRFQALSYQHRARYRARTHEPWDHDLSRSQMLNQLSHPNAPDTWFLNRQHSRVVKRMEP